MQISLMLLLLGSSIVSWRRTGDLLNPVILMSVLFFSPMVIASLRFSWLQSENWSYETNVALFFVWLFWLVFPLLIICIKVKGVQEIHWRERLRISQKGILFIRLTAFGYLILFLFENHILADSFLPVSLGYNENLAGVHTERIFLLSLVTRNGRTFATLLGLLFFIRRNPFDLLLAAMVVSIPATRFARIDLMVGMISLVLIFYYLYSRSKKLLIATVLAFISMALLMVVLGNYRITHTYKYNVTYASGIFFKGTPGPFDAFAWYYGYFPLSFENFDRFVRNVPSSAYTYGLYTIRPLILGLTQLDNFIDGYPDEAYEIQWTNPISREATVSTALPQFYLDFGPVFIFVPLFLYMGLWLFLYFHKERNLYMLVAYVLYSSSFGMVAFQNLLTSPTNIYAIFMAFVILYISRERSLTPKLRKIF